MIMHKYLFVPFALLLITLTQAASAFTQDDFLPPEKAFQFSARMADPKTIVVSFKIADGYYLYRERPDVARSVADAVFLEALLDSGVSHWRAWAMYAAVRVFGRRKGE